MMIAPYTRPSKTSATTVGNRQRAQWSRLLRKRVYALVPPIEMMTAEEAAANATLTANNVSRKRWVTTRIRTDHLAVLQMLQARHLKATGKEISRSEAMAALMAAGIAAVIDHPSFGGEAEEDQDN